MFELCVKALGGTASVSESWKPWGQAQIEDGKVFSQCLQLLCAAIRWNGFFWVILFTFANSGVVGKISLLSRESASGYFKGLIRHISGKPPLLGFTMGNLGVWGSSAISSDPSLLLLFLAIVVLKEKPNLIAFRGPLSVCIGFFQLKFAVCSKAIHWFLTCIFPRKAFW